MRLFDRVKAHLTFPDMPVIVGDEIASQIDALPDSDIKGFPADWYGIVAPPFQQFWVEARTPSMLDENPVYRGVVIGVLENEKWMDPAARWAMMCDGFMYSELTGLVAYAGSMIIEVRDDGRLVGDGTNVKIVEHDHWAEYFKPAQHLPPAGGVPEGGLPSHAPYFLKSIGAMHRRVEVAHVKPTRQARRLSERKHGITLSDFYLLKVKPYEPREVEDFKRIGAPDRVTRREHEVRGHFKYFHPDRPMFGRPGASGMVWVPDHSRGDDAEGKIEKGYEVK